MLRHFNDKLNLTAIIALVLFGLGAGLRLILFWANPPNNAYDNHFEPIFFIMQYGLIPPKKACWECYHPPLFYYTSAQLGWVFTKLGANDFQIMKGLQFVSCFFGIANLAVIHMVLKKLPLSDFSRLLAFATVCFLPVHIYMSAIHSNDTITYFFVSLCVYLAFIAIDKKFAFPYLAGLSIVMGVTLFTKYTALIIFPTISIIFMITFLKQDIVSRKKTIISSLLVILIPAIMLYWQASTNIQDYGKPFPMNIDFYPKKTNQIPGDEISFFSFKPWAAVKVPILSPENVKSFWTIIYGRMWYDMEPKFLYFIDNDQAWWDSYFGYLHGREPTWPGINLSKSTILIGSTLISMGLLPLFLMLFGGFSWLFRKWNALFVKENLYQTIKLLTLLILFISNALGIILFTSRYPVFSFMKASYFLNSLAAFAAYLGLGIMSLERWRVIRYILVIYFSILFLIVILHITQIYVVLIYGRT